MTMGKIISYCANVETNHPRTCLEGLRNTTRNLSRLIVNILPCETTAIFTTCLMCIKYHCSKCSLAYQRFYIQTNNILSHLFIYLWIYIYYTRMCPYQNHELSFHGLHAVLHHTYLSGTSIFFEHKIIFKPYNQYTLSLVWFLWTQQLSWAVLALYVIKPLYLRAFCIMWWVKKQTSCKIMLH